MTLLYDDQLAPHAATVAPGSTLEDFYFRVRYDGWFVNAGFTASYGTMTAVGGPVTGATATVVGTTTASVDAATGARTIALPASTISASEDADQALR